MILETVRLLKEEQLEQAEYLLLEGACLIAVEIIIEFVLC